MAKRIRITMTGPADQQKLGISAETAFTEEAIKTQLQTAMAADGVIVEKVELYEDGK